MQPRINNPATFMPDALPAIQAVIGAAFKAGLSPTIHALTHLRTSQINGCCACIDGGIRHAKKAGETDQRLHAVAAWREAPYFSDPERAALALSEYMTRMSDNPDPVPDEIWNEAAKHFDEKTLAALVLSIATTNLFNRLNVTTKQLPGDW